MGRRGAYGPLGWAVLVAYWALAPVVFVWAGQWRGVDGRVVGGLVLAAIVLRPVHCGPLTRIAIVVPMMVFLTLPKEILTPWALWAQAFPLMVGHTLWAWLDPVPFVLRLVLLPLLVAVTVAVTFVAGSLAFLLHLPFFGLFHAENLCRQRARDRAAERILRQALTHPGAGGDVPRFSLYLRPFKTSGKIDTLTTGVQATPDTHPGNIQLDLESQLAGAFPAHRPLIAAGGPGRLLSTTPKHSVSWPVAFTWGTPGTGKFRCTNRNWKERVSVLARHAELIVIVPLAFKGTLWEIRWLREQGLLHKCVFFMPPSPHGSDSYREQWKKVRPFLRRLGLEAPAYDSGGKLLVVRADGGLMTTPPGLLSSALPGSLPLLIDFARLRARAGRHAMRSA
ncbi:MAG: hypothetical protein HOQ47_02080 [Streptomyces sp.]|nr:hypothetical protein [Streptomyces sp.]NUS27340.1 hypothetical protein [Streptomyces sp.]